MDFLRKLLDVTRNQDFCLSFLLLNLPYFFFILPCLSSDNISPDFIIGAIGKFLVPTYVLSLFFFRVNRKIRSAVLFLTGTVSVLDIICGLLLHQPFYLSYLSILMDTNARESSEFLQAHLELSLESILLVACCVPVLFPRIRERIFRCWQVFYDQNYKTIVAFSIFFCLAYFWGAASNLLETRLPMGNNLLRLSLDAWQTYWTEKPAHEKVIPTVASYDDSIPYIVVVLGESANKHHHAVYGYELPTTPWADSEQAKGNLAVYTDALATQHFTIAAVKDIFSMRHAGDREAFESVPNIFDLLKQTSYQTSWLSNQENVGTIGSFENTISNACDVHAFTHPASANSDSNPVYDEALLPLLDKQLDEGRENQFILLHLMGSHQWAKNRYPEEYKRFTEADETIRADVPADAKRIRAEYDNSILYTDAVLKSVAERLEDKDALVIYLSDHGEDVYDYEFSTFAGHSPQGSDEELYVPFYVWSSRLFQQNHSEVWQQLKSNVGNPMKTDSFPEFFWEIIQLRVE